MTAGGDEASVRAFLERSGGRWLSARVPAAQLEALRARDHHVVRVDGRDGILLAYHLWSEPAAVEPRVFVLFLHVGGHPRASAELQAIVDGVKSLNE